MQEFSEVDGTGPILVDFVDHVLQAAAQVYRHRYEPSCTNQSALSGLVLLPDDKRRAIRTCSSAVVHFCPNAAMTIPSSSGSMSPPPSSSNWSNTFCAARQIFSERDGTDKNTYYFKIGRWAQERNVITKLWRKQYVWLASMRPSGVPRRPWRVQRLLTLRVPLRYCSATRTGAHTNCHTQPLY